MLNHVTPHYTIIFQPIHWLHAAPAGEDESGDEAEAERQKAWAKRNRGRPKTTVKQMAMKNSLIWIDMI